METWKGSGKEEWLNPDFNLLKPEIINKPVLHLKEKFDTHGHPVPVILYYSFIFVGMHSAQYIKLLQCRLGAIIDQHSIHQAYIKYGCSLDYYINRHFYFYRAFQSSNTNKYGSLPIQNMKINII
jgi:hypothetical protein